MIELYSYKVPFKRSLTLGNQVIDHREGILIHFTDQEYSLWSEASPLPGFSAEPLETVKSVLHASQTELDTHLRSSDEASWYQWLENALMPASCRFALDALFHSSQAAKKGLPLHTYLDANAVDQLRCNALIGILSDEEYPVAIDKVIRDGYRTIKFKIQDPTRLVNILKPIRDHFPDLHLRFDANGSWPIEMASDWAAELSLIRPQYLEQPFPKGQEQAMANLQSRIDFTLAADESCTDMASLLHLQKIKASKVFILKPALIGSFREIHAMINRLKEHQTPFTMTTLLESGIARGMITSLCAAWADPDTDHGLNTGALFAQDLVVEPKSGDPSSIHVDHQAGAKQPNRTLIHRL